MKTIELTRNKVAIVDFSDWLDLNNHSWHCAKVGYAARRVTISKNNSRIVYMHRVIMEAKPGEEVDHINGNRLDNRKSNLRICTHQQNMINWDNRRGTSKYRGVSYCKRDNKWKAQIQSKGKNRLIGRFRTQEDAARAYNEQARIEFKEFALLNYIPEDHYDKTGN